MGKLSINLIRLVIFQMSVRIMQRPNNMPAEAILLQDEIPRRNARRHPMAGVRDRLFHALFRRLTLTYARKVPHSVRRVIEFVFLVQVRKDD